MSVQEGTILTGEMQRSAKLCAHGTYEYQRTPPKTAPAATTASGDISEFEVPAKCINQSKYRLEFTLTTSSHSVPKAFIDGICPIREIQFMTQGGRYMAHITNLNKYTNGVFRRTTPFTRLATMERVPQESAAATARYFEGLSMGTQLEDTRIPPSAGAHENPNEPYLEPMMICHTTAGTAAELAINFKIPLNLIKDSIFNVNRDINFNEITLIRIIWDDKANVGFVGTANDNTASGIAVLTSYTITNLYLRYAIQKNQSIIDMIKEEKRQEIMIPYLYHHKIQGNAGGSTNLTIKYSNVHGSRLVRFYWIPYNNAESATTIFDHDNLAGSKITTFHVEVDGNRLCPYEFTTANGDDYDANGDLLTGSCILSRNDHLKYFAHTENFGANYPICREFDYERQLWKEGMPLEKEVKIDIYYTGGATQAQNYIFVVCQRRLVVDKDSGINIDSGLF